MNDVAVLFTRSDSSYLGFAVEVFNASRDARSYDGPWPVVAHPPCRGWGKLRHLAKPRPDELELALFAVHAVRFFGGVVEHPEGSKLWAHQGLPLPGQPADSFGGWTLTVEQSRWAHRATKRTWLYIVGLPPERLPPLPPPRRGGVFVENMCVAEREHSPRAFAAWLLEVARRCIPD